jgi:hypothetical protein
MVSVQKKKYPKIELVLRSKASKLGALTIDDCMELIGWAPESPEEKYGKEFTLKDAFGKKIRLLNNPTNRFFGKALAMKYANEHLRKSWTLNLETIVVDENGYVLQGQHRLVGFILAEQMRQLQPDKWGKNPLLYETALGFGVPSNHKVANTYDTGRGRKLDDVLFRRKLGKDNTEKQQRKISKVLSTALKLVWLRVGGKTLSFAPHFPHTEAIKFLEEHPDVLESVKAVIDIDEGDEGKEQNISSLLGLGTASALHYLMWQAVDDWEKAVDFWESVASGEGLKKGDAIHTLRAMLIKSDASSGTARDEVVGAVINTWKFWVKGENATLKQIKVPRKKVGEKFVLADFPRIGGLDDTVDAPVELTQHQLVILNALKGEPNPHSLCARELVTASKYEPEEGEKVAPLKFSLKKK